MQGKNQETQNLIYKQIFIFDKGVSQQENKPNYDRRTLSGGLQGHRAKRD